MICVNCGKEIDVNLLKENQINFVGDAKICTDCVTHSCSRKKIVYHNFSDRLVIEDNIFNEIRTIVILLNNEVTKGYKKFREIVGLDVLTGGIVKIVDENGKKYGCHTDSEYISKLKINDVIKAPFKLADDVRYNNTWRIVGNYEIIGKTRLTSLREKYRWTHFFDICVEFDDVIAFAKETNKSFYCLIRFKNHTFLRNGQKLFLSMLKERAWIDETNKNFAIKEGNNYKGIALLYVSNSNGKTEFFVKHLYSHVQNIELDTVSSINSDIQKRNSIQEEKFEILQDAGQDYYQIRENVQRKMTLEDIENIKADFSSHSEIANERVKNKIMNNFLNKRNLTI